MKIAQFEGKTLEFDVGDILSKALYFPPSKLFFWEILGHLLYLLLATE
jgi:hypothetical protein